ncbi:TonB-dependent receptor [Colwellia sp. 6_MG-2023]|uniref:TonB-dependent receptor n=1 Tax=Colwellia sp. 6_MG-2023 TaxID=3062676 RepID=UPI0026E1AD6C|nr:TonB-dependent receptor [Colwellia sp. 6_MG-2023]MDO6487354.1 TonB-dependent receptor [Colwellia sp. 6_MG-2023]
MKSKAIDTIFTKTALAISIALFSTGNLAYAQDNEASSAEDIEKIEIRGIRGSLISALDNKRIAPNFVDSIVAEDIGKFPDENVAESLQRISGVSIDRSTIGGEGNSISIRGLGPDFSRVFINGRTILGSSNQRQVNFSDLPSEMISRLDVYKSPMASLIEGGIGGTVEIKTASPFDSGGGFRAAGSAQGVNTTLADEWKPRISGQISNTFADNTVGVLLGLQYQDRITRQDTMDVPGWQCVLLADIGTACPTGADSLTEVPLEERAFRPRFSRQFARTLSSERTGFTGAIHWRPNDNAKLDFDVFYSTRDDIESQGTVITSTQFQNSIITANDNLIINDNNTITAFDATSADLRVSNRELITDYENLVLGLNGEITVGLWTYSADLSYSEGSSNEKNNQAQIFREVDGSWNYDTASGIPIADLGQFSDNPTSTSGWYIFNARKQVNFRKQDEINARFDIKREINGSLINSVEFGMRYTSGGLALDAFGFFSGLPRDTVEQFESDNNISGILTTTEELMGLTNFGNTLPNNDMLINNWTIATSKEIQDIAFPDDPLTNVNGAGTYTIDEETLAGYVQLNYGGEFAGLFYSGNLGVRAVQTDVKTTGGTSIADFDNLQTGDYTDILPSFNLSIDLSDELVLRIGAAKVMSRPSYNNLNPGTTVNTTTFSGNSGNPSLLPSRASQFDAALEWYFDDSDVLALSYFYKHVDSFVQTETVTTTVDPALSPGFDPNTLYAISRPGNGEGANISGFDLLYQHTFKTLPSPFDGLGFLANYTYLSTDAKTTNTNVGLDIGLEGLSENAYNITTYYEKYGFSFRVSYNWRDEFLQAAQGTGGTPIFGNEYGQVDASASYDLNEHVTFVLEAKNLNNESYRAYEYLDGRLSTYNEFGRRFTVGIRARF